jgi:hypothetical protein
MWSLVYACLDQRNFKWHQFSPSATYPVWNVNFATSFLIYQPNSNNCSLLLHNCSTGSKLFKKLQSWFLITKLAPFPSRICQVVKKKISPNWHNWKHALFLISFLLFNSNSVVKNLLFMLNCLPWIRLLVVPWLEARLFPPKGEFCRPI